MSNAFMLPNAQTINEDEALVNGVDASCGPTASYIAAGIVNDFDLSQQGLQQLVGDAERAGTLNTGGQLFSTGPQWDLAQYGINSNVSTPSNATQLQSTLDNALKQNKPVVLGLQNANQLTDEPPGLYGHFVTAVGMDPNGDYVISDPNLGVETSNTLGQLFAAQPVSLTTPTKGGSGVPSNAFPSQGALGFPSLIQIELPDLTADAEHVIGDIFPFTQVTGWMFNFWKRVTFGILGGVIFIVSFDYFLGTFKPIGVQRGPILTGILRAGQAGKKGEQALQEKGEEIAGVATKAAAV